MDSGLDLDTMKLGALKKRAASLGADPESIDALDDADDPRAAAISLIGEISADLEGQKMSILQEELEGLTLRALKTRAKELGADTEALDAADDTDDPKAAVIAHILELQSTVKAPTEQEIRDELEPLKLRALKARAKEQGLAEAAIEEIDDADDPKAATIDALVKLLLVPAEGVPPEQPKVSVRELRRTAASAGVPSPAIDAALDDADPAAALETLIAATRRASDAGNARKKELTQLPVRRLRELSAEAGATEATIEACLDSDTPKPSLVELLLKLERQREEAKESQLREMRAQLMQLPLREVRQRAITAGASADSIDDALDNDNAQEAMVDVAIAAAQQCPPTTSGGGTAVPALETPKPKAKEAASAVRKASAPFGEKPHFGSTGKLAPVALPEGRHVMLSYQWSLQDKVVRVRKALQARGVNCWMDIDGGMKNDIYESMAEGVQSAAVVVPFMSEGYQKSENCKLELKFSMQLGVPIVPVLLQKGWQQSGWLGILTAGLLWTPMFDDDVEAHSEKLLSQINLALTGEEAAVAAAGGEVDLLAAKEELERLASKISPAAQLVSTAAAQTTAARLPAEVPSLPPFMLTTPDMYQTQALLIGTGDAPDPMTVVVVGMGGIGKTMYLAWLCHQDPVREAFEQCIWLNFGQEFNLEQVFQLAYLQAEGQELSQELPADQKREYLRIALQGRQILLVIDDVWASEELQQLSVVIDRNTNSKILVSSRIRGITDGDSTAAVVDAQLPSMEDAVRLLLGSAEMATADPASSSPSAPAVVAPPEAMEIAKMCNRLPLALGICGKILKSLALTTSDSWQGVIDVIQEVMHESTHQRSIEESVILASLKGLPEDAQRLFYCIGLAPEDSNLTLDAIVVLYGASLVGRGLDSTKPMTILRARRLITRLIDSSLLTGAVDSFSVHDIVLDHARSSYSPEQWRTAQTSVVERLCAMRPVEDLHGWEDYAGNHTLSPYVAGATLFHIRAAVNQSDEQEGTGQVGLEVAVNWLSQGIVGYVDAIPRAAGKVLGFTKLVELAEAAEAAGQYWLASVRWSVVVRTCMDESGRSAKLYELIVTQLVALSKVTTTATLTDSGESSADGAEAAVLQLYRDRLQLRALVMLICSWDSKYLETYAPSLAQLVQGPTGAELMAEDPVTQYLVSFIFIVPSWFQGNPKAFGEGIYRLSQDTLQAAQNLAESDNRKAVMVICSVGYSFMANHVTMMVEATPGFDWDAVKERLENSVSRYRYGIHHQLTELITLDPTLIASDAFALTVHWGDLGFASRQYNEILLNTDKAADEARPSDSFTVVGLLLLLVPQLFAVGLSETAARHMRQHLGQDCDKVDEVIEHMYAKFMIPMYNVKQLAAIIKLNRVLVDASLTPVEVRKLLHPLHVSSEAIADGDGSAAAEAATEEMGPRTFALLALSPPPPTQTLLPCLNYHSIIPPCALAALTFCKLGWDNKALAFAEEALRGVQTDGGDQLATTRTFALMAKAQVHARQGAYDLAKSAFDESAQAAATIGFGLYEILALFGWREMALSAANGDGGGELASDGTAAASLPLVEERWAQACGKMVSSEAEFEEVARKFWRPIEGVSP